MANKSNWKGTESKAAALFPGGKRRHRVGLGDYYLIADDIVWGHEHIESEKIPGKNGKRAWTQRRVVKNRLQQTGGEAEYPPVYIDAKKKTKTFLHTEFTRILDKYTRGGEGRLVIVRQKFNDKLILVTVDGDFFEELIEAWCVQKGVDF